MTLGEKGWQAKKLEDMPEETTLPSDLTIKFELGGGVWKDSERFIRTGQLV